MELFDAQFLFASLFWGSVGLGYFVYGKKQGEPVPLVGGLVMIACSYIIGSALLMSLVGAALMTAVWMLKKRGW